MEVAIVIPDNGYQYLDKLLKPIKVAAANIDCTVFIIEYNTDINNVSCIS